MYYFPDKFLKVVPPKEYFWQVYAVIKPEDYKSIIDKAKSRLITFKKIQRNNISITQEALAVFNDFNEEDISLLSIINKQRTQIE